MTLKDIKEAIEGLEEEFGDKVLDRSVWYDGTFGNEIIVDLGECITTLVNVPCENEE